MLNSLITKIYVKGIKFIKNDNKGQSLVEYGLIIALIAVAAIVVLKALGVGIQGTFKKILEALPS